MRSQTAYAYVHGYDSGPQSIKGRHVAATLVARGIRLHIPDLNPPSIEQLTYSGMLHAFEQFTERFPSDTQWRLIGSSMGGLIASRWSQTNPDRIDRLLLLAPGFDLPSHWRTLLGPEAVLEWESSGYLNYPDADGSTRRVPWGLMADASRYPAFPTVTCPTLILHGVHDTTVPIDSSRRYVARVEGAHLVTLDDDHDMMNSLNEIDRHALSFLAGDVDSVRVKEPGDLGAQ